VLVHLAAERADQIATRLGLGHLSILRARTSPARGAGA
jgi:hypothetical protein